MSHYKGSNPALGKTSHILICAFVFMIIGFYGGVFVGMSKASTECIHSRYVD